MNSDTPRTDAQQDSCNIPLDSSACVSASFARELERENAALREELTQTSQNALEQMNARHEADSRAAKFEADNAALRETIETALNVYLSEPDSSADHTEIAHSMYAILERAALSKSP